MRKKPRFGSFEINSASDKHGGHGQTNILHKFLKIGMPLNFVFAAASTIFVVLKDLA